MHKPQVVFARAGRSGRDDGRGSTPREVSFPRFRAGCRALASPVGMLVEPEKGVLDDVAHGFVTPHIAEKPPLVLRVGTHPADVGAQGYRRHWSGSAMIGYGSVQWPRSRS
jgi:hypothetical protein